MKRHNHGRLSLEQLEDRLVPTTYLWYGATGGGNWDNPNCWYNNTDGRLGDGYPQSGDIAQFGYSERVVPISDCYVTHDDKCAAVRMYAGYANVITLHIQGGGRLGILAVSNSPTSFFYSGTHVTMQSDTAGSQAVLAVGQQTTLQVCNTIALDNTLGG